ncbi:MAG: hypothetical protein FJ098_09510 [Deltaproteobacteria bacterium]|nr:hypothetical protein [Deltaproteobacteria bacterium]
MIRAVGRQTGWAWILQRLTALFLAFGLLLHFWVLHYAKLGNAAMAIPSESRWVGARFLASPVFWMVFDGLLLATALYHALNGMYGIFQDYNPSKRAAAAWAWGLWLAGIALLGLGLSLLPRFAAFAAGA